MLFCLTQLMLSSTLSLKPKSNEGTWHCYSMVECLDGTAHDSPVHYMYACIILFMTLSNTVTVAVDGLDITLGTGPPTRES